MVEKVFASWKLTAVLLLMFTASSILTVRVINGATQESVKSLTRKPVKNDPLQVVSINTKAKKVKPDESFEGDDEWVRDISLTLKNVSNKPT